MIKSRRMRWAGHTPRKDRQNTDPQTSRKENLENVDAEGEI
jgi:hypothetical protein